MQIFAQFIWKKQQNNLLYFFSGSDDVMQNPLNPPTFFTQAFSPKTSDGLFRLAFFG